MSNSVSIVCFDNLRNGAVLQICHDWTKEYVEQDCDLSKSKVYKLPLKEALAIWDAEYKCSHRRPSYSCNKEMPHVITLCFQPSGGPKSLVRLTK